MNQEILYRLGNKMINESLNPMTEMCNGKYMWDKNHPLTEIFNKLYNFTAKHMDKTEDHKIHSPLLKMAALINVMYHDFNNNGGGNACCWSISKEFKRAIRAAKLPRDVIKHLDARLSDVYRYVARGYSFGFPVDGFEHELGQNLEKLIVDTTYFAAKGSNLI